MQQITAKKPKKMEEEILMQIGEQKSIQHQ